MAIESKLTGKVVLIVDDEEEMRKAIAFDFLRRGCIVYEAPDGTEALKIVESKKVDIMISDVRMPNGDGVQLTKNIRALNAREPIILLATGFADLNEVEALKLGAHGLLDKPIDRKKLLAIIEQLTNSP